jgi:HK/GC/Chemotaxis protein-like, sensor domain
MKATENMMHFRLTVRNIGIASIVLITILSLGVFFYIQSITEANVKSNLFEQQKELQIQTTKSISEHASSDINLVLSMLDGLANSLELQQGQLFGNETTVLLQQKYDQYSHFVNRLFILDKNNIVTTSLVPKGSEPFLGQDLSTRGWVQQTRNQLIPVFSGGFEQQDIYSIFVSYPIINRHTHEYIGIVGTSIPTVPFFAHYGNVEHIDTQFLVAYDKEGTILADGASDALLGQNFFGKYTQAFINHNQVLNNLTRNLLSTGSSGYAVYDYGRGERLTTQSPIFLNGKPIFFLQVVTPTNQIYSKIQDTLTLERYKMLSLLLGTISAVVVLTVFLLKWNRTLEKEAKARTLELYESERKSRELEQSYDAMKRYLDQVMKEVRKSK